MGEDGTPSGKTISRYEAHCTGALHGAAHICIYRYKNGVCQILLQKRSANKDSFPCCYDLAAAGHVEVGSDFLTTALRELYEELGLEASQDQLKHLFDMRIEGKNIFHGELFFNREICRVYALEHDAEPNSFKIQHSELSEVKWFDLSCVVSQIENGSANFCTDRKEIKLIAAKIK